MCISYKIASLNLTAFACCCYVWVMLLLFATFFALLLLIVTNIIICTFSSDVSSKFGLRFMIVTIRSGSISLNLSKVISFSIFLCQFRIFLIIIHSSIKAAFQWFEVAMLICIFLSQIFPVYNPVPPSGLHSMFFFFFINCCFEILTIFENNLFKITVKPVKDDHSCDYSKVVALYRW